jgi:hypothetical protein
MVRPIGPGASASRLFDFKFDDPPEVLEGLIARARTGEQKLVFDGVVTYGDALSENRAPIEFCFYWHEAGQHFHSCQKPIGSAP